MKVLALSSSRVGDSAYLEPAVTLVEKLLGSGPRKLAFIPFASVDSHDDYLKKVKKAFHAMPYSIELVTKQNAENMITNCEGIVAGGGNTFKLLHDLYDARVLELIKSKIKNNIPYVGWSAGSNILGQNIGTTNDMPIIQPKSFDALQIFPFNINPHYVNQSFPGFNGETRLQRIVEFLKMNRNISVVALPEGTALMMDGDQVFYEGKTNGLRFYFLHEVKTDILRDKEEVLS